MRKIFTLCTVLLVAVFAQAQTKTVTDVRQLWLAYNNQTRLSDRWGLWLDMHLRTKENFTKDFSTSIVRPGIMYYINDNAKFTLGYSWVNLFPAEGHEDISQPEHRIWQQLQWHTKFQHTRLMQWFRLEEKFRRNVANDSTLAPGHFFNYKMRYNVWYEVPVTKNGTGAGALSAIVNDELHINFGKKIVYNYFDQNRFFVGLKVNTNAHDNIQIGYMNQFVQSAAGNRFRNVHAVRVFYFQNLDWRKKTATP